MIRVEGLGLLGLRRVADDGHVDWLQALDDAREESKFKPRLRDAYRDQVVPALMKEFGYKNIMQVPKLDRIVLNVGMSEAIQNVKLLEGAATERNNFV